MLGFAVGIVIIVVAGGIYMAGGGSSTGSKNRAATPKLPAAAQAKNAEAAKEKQAKVVPDTVLSMARTVPNEVYQPGAMLDITLAIASQGSGTIRALGIEETLPKDWHFDGISFGERPDLVPQKGHSGKLEFAWFNIPKFPITFTYRVEVPAEIKGSQQIAGEALYRLDGPEIRTPSAVTALNPGTLAAPIVAEKAAPAPAVPASGPGMDLARTIPAGGYTPGAPLDVELNLNYGSAATNPATAVALVEQLPAGWKFEKATGAALPSVVPKPGTEGKLEFVWINPPAWPAAFTYQVTVPAGETGGKQLSGQVVYRANGPEERSTSVNTDVNPK
jgi:hypothetical protein